MSADLSVLPGPHLVLLAAGDAVPRSEACGLCSVPVLVGPFFAALHLADGRAAFTCRRCQAEVDPVLAAICEALNTIAALTTGLDDRQHLDGLARALHSLAGSLPEPERNES